MSFKKNVAALIFLFAIFSAKVFAQNYPVNITTQLVAPFTGYISDYANPGEEKLKILFLFTDFTKPHYNVKLKISIQGQGITIQSKNNFFDGPHTLQPGIPLELSGSDLYNLLNTQNLDFSGITRSAYEQKKVLPEGFYSVCITAYDYNNPTPIQVSNSGCAQAWMVLSDPPFLNLPLCNSTVAITNPQQQTFSFTQMNMGSPNSAASTEYVFELWEIRPQGAVPNNIVQTVPPIYTYTANFTTINYGITEPPLLAGMQYAWRVKAQDITGRDYFKNNGYSQVCTFTYGSQYDGTNLNLNLHAQAVSQRQIKVWWDSLANFTSYKLEFRKTGGNNWFPVNTFNSHVRVLDLEPQTTYEFHVQGLSSEFTSPFSSVVNSTTQAPPNYQCGELPLIPTSANFSPLQSANVNMFWQVGQFEMQVTALENTMSANGVYSGYGKIKMPFINYVGVSFQNISVSSEQVVVQGRVNALTQGIDAWVNDNTIGSIQDGTAEAEIHTNTPLTPNDISVNTGNGTVIVGGTTYTYTPSGTTIEDSQGNLFIVTADGHVINAGTAGSGHGAVPEKKNYIKTDKGIVVFNGGAKQLYGMDKYKYPSMVNYYLDVRNVTTGNRDAVDWKSVMAQKYDVIDLNYQLLGNLKADSIFFISGTGTIYKPQGSGNARQLYVIGGKHGDVQELFACYRYSKDSLVNIAKINIVSYRNEQNKVTLVPLGSGITIDKTQMQKALNDIYKQSVATWEVDIAPAIMAGDTLWDKDGNGKLNVGSDIFNRYSSEVKAINKYVRAQSYYNKGQYYLVVTNKPTDSLSAGLLGEMPRGRNIGYLFTSTPTARLVAHELGHGAFALEHSFSGNAVIPQGTSACLMDYSNGTDLYKGKYWDYVHDPITVVGVTEGDDDGAVIPGAEVKVINGLFNKIKKACLENKSLVLLRKECGYEISANGFYLGGYFYKNITVSVPVCTTQYISCFPKSKVLKTQRAFWNTQKMRTDLIDIILIDNTIEIVAPPAALDKIIDFLDPKTIGKNLLIFSNGYRPNPPHLHNEHAKEADEVNFTDRFGYWGGIDALFINRIGTKNVVYADGHASVSTSNHLSETEFTANYAMWFCVAKPASGAVVWDINPITALLCYNLFHDSVTFKLHTTANNDGFLTRKSSGKLAGIDLISKIVNGIIPFNPATDTIDIVSHSMGHAYACGIIDALKESPLKFKLGRFYSLAPENGCSINGGIPLSLFQEVWQYGCNEKNVVWEQDGIAPQCEIKGLGPFSTAFPNRYGRIYFPTQFDPKDFLGSHSIVSYFWIFTDRKPGMNGYIKPRK